MKYCGESYLLAVLDIYDEVTEYNEKDNVAAANAFRIVCADSTYSMLYYFGFIRTQPSLCIYNNLRRCLPLHTVNRATEDNGRISVCDLP